MSCSTCETDGILVSGQNRGDLLSFLAALHLKQPRVSRHRCRARLPRCRRDRSRRVRGASSLGLRDGRCESDVLDRLHCPPPFGPPPFVAAAACAIWIRLIAILWRSEEHTSELQSLRHLVCRLLPG